MTVSILACILTVAIGCYIFLYLAAKQHEVTRKDRQIRYWAERRAAEQADDDTPLIADVARAAPPLLVPRSPTAHAIAESDRPQPTPQDETPVRA